MPRRRKLPDEDTPSTDAPAGSGGMLFRTLLLKSFLSSPEALVATLDERLKHNRLEVNAPYLAGTYDERMFEELRWRAQTFEVLLGGDLSGGRSDGNGATSKQEAEDVVEDQGESCAAGLTALPEQMAESLRVDLSVWRGVSA